MLIPSPLPRGSMSVQMKFGLRLVVFTFGRRDARTLSVQSCLVVHACPSPPTTCLPIRCAHCQSKFAILLQCNSPHPILFVLRLRHWPCEWGPDSKPSCHSIFEWSVAKVPTGQRMQLAPLAKYDCTHTDHFVCWLLVHSRTFEADRIVPMGQLARALAALAVGTEHSPLLQFGLCHCH